MLVEQPLSNKFDEKGWTMDSKQVPCHLTPLTIDPSIPAHSATVQIYNPGLIRFESEPGGWVRPEFFFSFEDVACPRFSPQDHLLHGQILLGWATLKSG